MQTLRDRLLSDENIYLSIYLANSYIQNKELLSDEDLDLLYKLNDVFNKDVVLNTITTVRNRIDSLLNDDSFYFDVQVYFKPKKYENGKTSFRPLHTATLIDQIAMIAMLQILVYDVNPRTNELLPSELSRLIPSNFYGNRISYNGTELFKPWQEQYHEYTALKLRHRSSDKDIRTMLDFSHREQHFLICLGETILPIVVPVGHIIGSFPSVLTDLTRHMRKVMPSNFTFPLK